MVFKWHLTWSIGVSYLSTAAAQSIKALTMVLSICGTPPSITPSELETVLSTKSYSVKNIMNRCSNGKSSFESVTVPYVVNIPCTMSSYSCDTNGWAEMADNIVRTTSPTIPIDTFKNRIYILPLNVGCSFGGLGIVGPCPYFCRVWIAGSVVKEPATYVHELGHNMGLNHAIYNNNEYGDWTSAMGGCCFVGCYNAAQTDYLRWTSPQQTFNVPIPAAQTVYLKKNEYVKIGDPTTRKSWFVQWRIADFPEDRAYYNDTINVYSMDSGSSYSTLWTMVRQAQMISLGSFTVQYNTKTTDGSQTQITVY